MVNLANFTWYTYKRPLWQSYLEDLSESAVRETGLSREKLKQVLEVMYEHRVIN